MVAFIGALGAAAWVYGKTQRKTGNNTTSSLTVAALVGGLVFVALLALLAALF